jgi:hypothetical protein
MSVNNPYSENIILKLINNMNENELKEVVDFIEFIKNKDEKIRRAGEKRISLQGVMSDSLVLEEDFKEAKKIWK